MFLRVLAILFLGAWSCLCRRQLELGSVSNAPSACDSGSTQCKKSVPEAAFSPATALNVSNGHSKPPPPSQSTAQRESSVEAVGGVSSGKNNTPSQKNIIFSGNNLTTLQQENGTAAQKHLSLGANRTISARSTSCDRSGFHILGAKDVYSYWCNMYATNTKNAYWEYVYVKDDGDRYIESWLSIGYDKCRNPSGTGNDYKVHGWGDRQASVANYGLIKPGDYGCLVLDSDSSEESRVDFIIEYNFYDWYAYSWSSCSASCGYGTQTRNVRCALNRGSGSTVSASNCVSANKPTTSQSCYTACSPPPPSPSPSTPPPSSSPPPPPSISSPTLPGSSPPALSPPSSLPLPELSVSTLVGPSSLGLALLSFVWWVPLL